MKLKIICIRYITVKRRIIVEILVKLESKLLTAITVKKNKMNWDKFSKLPAVVSSNCLLCIQIFKRGEYYEVVWDLCE